MRSLDIETGPLVDHIAPLALEPWRVITKEAEITVLGVSEGHSPGASDKQIVLSTNKGQLGELIRSLKGKEVWAHNALFDVSFLVAYSILTNEFSLDDLKRIKWRDSSLLAKWLLNGQKIDKGQFSMSLANLVKFFVEASEYKDEFLDVKKKDVTPGQDFAYWLKRNLMDCHMTNMLVERLWKHMQSKPRMMRGFLIEQDTIVHVAIGYVTGMMYDEKRAGNIRDKLPELKAKLATKVGVDEQVINSPTQLGNFLFSELGLQPISKSPKGKPSTKKDDIMMLHHNMARTKYGPILKAILDYKKLATMESKFINGFEKVGGYTGDGRIHSTPRIFGTYTGRFTYESKWFKKAALAKGIATHQLPRKGPVRKCICAPEGYEIAELDAAQQELRGIAQESRDERLLEGFLDGVDLHSAMSVDISGIPYDEFQRRYHADDAQVTNFRYAGKLLNLSCQYRIGAPALASKFFTNYEIIISRADAGRYLRLYKNRYRGVVKYWDDAIAKAKTNGYAETIGGRRYKIHRWSDYKWGSESSAINFPVQGFGGDHKELAIKLLGEKYPEVIFFLDLHDGLWYYVPSDHGKELVTDMRDYINTVKWSDYWDADVLIPLPFDGKIGRNMGELSEV